MPNSRLSPDQLLERAATDERQKEGGRLKIYLGMVAGVGKTYAMLSDAIIELKRGKRVLAGYIEPHGRVDTEDLARQIPQVPLRTVEYRGIKLQEFDLDQALIEKPDILLVDELAHTNAPNSRHLKRYQDIEELCSKGITVWTTLNIQHIESLREVISNITGVEIRETVPDAVLAQATEIELIDIPPDELIHRLESGKIYSADKVDPALRNFFRKGNLVALREIVLRHAADTVDAQLRTFRSLEGVDKVWATNPRVLVSIAPSKFALRLIHAAVRLARNLKAPLVAMTVETTRTRSTSEEEKANFERAITSAEKLGAEIIRVSGHDIVREILKVAGKANATIIVAGKPVRSKWREFVFGSIVDDLIRRSGNIDVMVVQGSDEERVRAPLISSGSGINPGSILESVLWVGLATVVCFLTVSSLAVANLALIYLLAVTWVASRHGRNEAIVASVLSVLCFDFFFVAPTWTFAVSDAQYFVTFIVMLVVALLISSLALRLKGQSALALDREQKMTTLFTFSKLLAECRSIEGLAKVSRDVLFGHLEFESVVFWPDRAGDLRPLNNTAPSYENDQNEIAVAKWTSDRKLPAGKSTDTLPGSKGFYLPLETSADRAPVWAIFAKEKEIKAHELATIEGLSHLLSSALERLTLEKEATEAHFKAQQEELRNLLLSSLSHDLRTPLTAICGAADTLILEPSISERNKQLALTISDSAARLTRMVRNVLDLSRLESGTLALNREWHSLEELVAVAIQRTEELLIGKAIKVDIPPDFPLLFVDGMLIEQVFVNLLENVGRHARSATMVKISAHYNAKELLVELYDDGPGLEVGAESQIFEKLVRGKDSHGFGLGLAICRTIIEAHGGTIVAKNRSEGGARFSITIPSIKEPA